MKHLICFFLIITLTRTSEIHTRIIGGFNANIRAYPFVAAINVKTPDSKHFCVGTLYGNEWIITAAQCLRSATLFTVNLGSATLNGQDANRLTLAANIHFIHPDFNPQTLENDIGLIKLRMPITHTDYIKSIDLLPSEDVNLGVQLYALGWGQTSDQEAVLSNQLQVAHILPISNEECKLTFGNQITDNMVCIVGNYNEGICHGDTGGPLISTERNGAATLVGIASFMSSNGCESPDPSGFTRTFSYVAWIRSITNT